jgi:AbrB family looped-hinge helix DNA binding protein
MAKVDAKGRIVLPQEVRERLDITPGTVVEVREEDGKAVIEPEDDPEALLWRMEQLVPDASDRERKPLTGDAVAGSFRETVREGAESDDE